ncbi:MAG TPA: AraC family ligand binding domain-containing protein, partial [Candidatus Mediterraneibacter ornithocaccae]|nr:AraC family ligand binding domain-containing protein [Candidatus Mediterraneibacter ornithocaccae]
MKFINYREEKEHGTFDFPMEFYHVGPKHPRYEMSYHWHIEYEVIRILKGELLMTIDEDEFTAKAGDIIFIKGGLLHGGIPKNCLYECIVFNLDSLMTSSPAGERLLKKISSDSIEINNHFSACGKELSRIAERMFGQMKTRAEGHELTVIGAFYEF